MMERGQQKALKANGTNKKQLEEHFATNKINLQQVSWRTGSKNCIVDNLDLSEVKMS